MSLKRATKVDQRDNALLQQALKNGPLTATSAPEVIRAAERMLKIAGYDVAVPDGSFDEKSLAALKQLDAAMGNEADGAFDAKSFAALKKIEARVRRHVGDKFIGKGQAGEQVQDAQEKLKRLGYELDDADGVYDAQTEAAVRQYKRDLGIDADPDFLGRKSLSELQKDMKELAHAPYRSRVTPKSKDRHRADAETAQAAQAGITEGSDTRAVKNLQSHLKAAGFDPGKADGKFDGRTKAMVELFQKKAGLPQTGVADADTWAALKKLEFKAKNGVSPLQSMGEKSSAVLHTEKVMRKLGFKHVKADGVFDRETQKASRAIEKKFHGLGKDGKIGKPQLERMETLLRARRRPGHGPTVKKGYHGHPVKQLELRLKRLGYKPGKVDGKFGKETARAVRRFQRDYNLTVDGIVGKQTWRMLGIRATGSVTAPGPHGSALGKQLAAASRDVANSMGGHTSLGRCAAGVSAAIQRVTGIFVGGNGNQIDDNLPRDKFKQVNISLEQALKIPGCIITWEHTSTALGSIFGHTAITWGDGHTTSSDFIEDFTTSNGRTGMKIFMPR